MRTTRRLDFGKGCFLLIAVTLAQLSTAQIRYVEIKSTSMVYCTQDNRIYATGAPDAKGTLANSVCRINPTTGKIEASVFVGANPRGMVHSADGKSLYVLVADNKMIRQVDRETMVAGVNFPVGENQVARTITCVSELPDSVIVHRYNPSVEPKGDNFCVFTKGQTKMSGVPCGDSFAHGIDPNRVISSTRGNCANYYFGINAMLHTEDGPSLNNNVNMPLIGNGYGLVIGTAGFLVDPEAHQNLGRMAIETNEICVDPLRPVVYELYDDQHPTVRCWDMQTLRELWKSEAPVPEGRHHLGSPIRYGVSGFAYSDGEYIICGQWNLGKPSVPVDLSITRTDFPKGNPEGKQFTYTLTVQNNSDAPSTGAYVTDTMPGVVEIKEITASQGTAIFAEGVIRAELGSIPARGTATVKVHLRVRDRGLGGYVAVVRSFDPDPDTSNNIYVGQSWVPHSIIEMGSPSPSAESDGLSATWKSLDRQANGSGENLSIQINGRLVIKNNGSQSTHPMAVRFYIQEGPNLAIDWAVLLQEVRVPSIGPGQSYTVDLQAPFDTNLDVVGLYVIANLDPLRVNGSTSNVTGQIK